MNAYRQKSSAEAKAILESGVSTLESLTSALTGMPYRGDNALSQAESAFVATATDDVEKANDVVDAAYRVTRDALANGARDTRVLERFVALHVPQMEVRPLRNCDATTPSDFLISIAHTNVRSIVSLRTGTTSASPSS